MTKDFTSYRTVKASRSCRKSAKCLPDICYPENFLLDICYPKGRAEDASEARIQVLLCIDLERGPKSRAEDKAKQASEYYYVQSDAQRPFEFFYLYSEVRRAELRMRAKRASVLKSPTEIFGGSLYVVSHVMNSKCLAACESDIRREKQSANLRAAQEIHSESCIWRSEERLTPYLYPQI